MSGEASRSHRFAVAAVVGVLALGATSACGRGGLPWIGRGVPSVTFADAVAPIVFRQCAPCHHQDGPAPFSLTRYEDVRRRARQIADVTARRYMPPWLPDAGDPPLVGERRLTDAEIGTLRRWADARAPLGDASRVPASPVFPSGWTLGQPDLVLEMPQAYMLPAEGSDVFRNFVFPSPVSEGRWVRAVEILPGTKSVVHHANLVVDPSGESRRRDAADPDVGFAGMEVNTEFERFEPDSHFLFWKPGTPPNPGSDRRAWRLDPGTDLVLNAHLQPSGKPEPIRAKLGLYFARTAPTEFPMLLQLEHDGALDIAPGDRSFTVEDEYVLPVDVGVLGVYPHAHYLGKELTGGADLPDGSRRTLIHIRDWDFAWQAVYEYAQPMALPRGTRLWMRYTYDNSDANPRNPNTTPRRVTAGDRATDEMAHLWVQVLPPRREDRLLLQVALMRRRLEKYPGDEVAHLNLAAALQSAGRLEEARAEYSRALEARPHDPVTLNGLGSVLHSQHRLAEAASCYERALAIRPEYAAARYNLATTRLAQGRASEAIALLSRVVRESPEDAAALSDLGSAYLQQNQPARATALFEQATRVNPDYVYGWWNLGNIQARRGRLSEAIASLERAASLRGDDAELRDDLGSALAAAGRMGDAIEQFEAALRIDPGYEIAARNLARARALTQRSGAHAPAAQ